MLIFDDFLLDLPDFYTFSGIKSREMAIYCYINDSTQTGHICPSVCRCMAHACLFV